jgi:hypothetical protein
MAPLLAYAPRLRPGDRISHTSALALLGAPLPDPAGSEVHVTMDTALRGSRLRGPRARGVVGHAASTGAVIEHLGLPISDPVTAFLEASTMLELDDLIAVADYLVLDPRVLEPGLDRPFTTLAELRGRANAASGRGVQRARSAAAHAREGVESPKETALRLLLHRAGIPEATCGYELLDGRRRIGWFDLAWPEFKTIAEYDGDRHRTSKWQYERDIRRYDDAADLDWRVVRVRNPGLGGRAADTIARVERALGRGGWSRRRKGTE